MPASGCSGSARGRITSRSQICAVVEVVDERLAGDRDGGRVEQILDLAQDRQQSAGAMEVLHQEAAGRLQVDEQRDAGADAVEVVEGEVDAEPAGDGEQVHDGVGRAADGGQGDDRVEERAAVMTMAGPAIRPSTISTASAPVVMGGLEQPAVRGRGAGDAGQRHAQRLGHQAHRRRGAHRVAVAAAADHRRLRLEELLCDRVPARTSSDSRQTSVPQPSAHAAERAGQHRTAGHDDRRQIDRGGGHQQRRDGLVASAEEHDAVDRVGPEHLLGRHRGHVAPEHRGRADQRLAEGHDRQVERDAAGLVDALLDASATSLRWALHGVRSDAVLAIAMCGRPSKALGREALAASMPDGCRRCGPCRRTTGSCAGTHQDSPSGC